jgi:glycerate 2-kinase
VALADVPGWAFLAGASDGRDGATDGAGAVVDGTTAARLRALGEDPALLVQRFASLHFHERAGTLIPRWTTRTNVADLHMLFLGELA